MQIVRTVYSIALAFTFGILLSKCAEESHPPKTASTDETFTALAEALPEPNKYQVRLNWKTEGAQHLWFLDRYEAGQKEERRESIIVDGNQRDYTDSEIEPGKHYTYYLLGQGPSKFGLKAEVQVPRDLELKGEVRNPDFTDVHRLYLREGAKIVTEGKALNIAVEELTSAGAIIETFAPLQKAPPNTNGRYGGLIIVKAEKARGVLQIVGHGESGGVGLDGNNGRDGAQGPQGMPGLYEVKPDEQLPMHKDAGERVRLKSYYGNKTHDDPMARWDLWFFCSQQTGDGGRGARADDGQDGMNGGNAGDSARVLVQVKTGPDFTVNVVSEPGKGAIGGRGGNGGRGGLGGPPGVRDNGHLCRQAQNGPPGPDGLVGRPGKFGDNGTRQPVCVQVGAKTTGDCPRE